MSFFVTTPHITLATDTQGAPSAEPLLLITGLGLQMTRWTPPFCAALADRGYRVIRFDNRDSGRSTHFADHTVPGLLELMAMLRAGQIPALPYTLREMVQDTLDLLDALEIERAHLVGQSMGGMIAQLLAAQHPERVISLTSIMSSTGNPALPPPSPDVLAMMTRHMPDPTTHEDTYLTYKVALARCLSGDGCPFDAEAHRALALEELKRGYVPGSGRRQFAAMAVMGDIRATLGTIRTPTLVMHGTHDPLLPIACGHDVAASMPKATLMALDGMGHDIAPLFYPAIVDAIDRHARQAIVT